MIVIPDLPLLLEHAGERPESCFYRALEAYRRSVEEWRSAFQNPTADFQRFLEQTFGPDSETLQRPISIYLRLLDEIEKNLGPHARLWLIGCLCETGSNGSGSALNASELAVAVTPPSERIVRGVHVDREDAEFGVSLQNEQVNHSEQRILRDVVGSAFTCVLQHSDGCNPSGAHLFFGNDMQDGMPEDIREGLAVLSVLAAVAVHGLCLERDSVIECTKQAIGTDENSDLDDLVSRAGFIHPPVRTEDAEELWEHRTISDLRTAERDAVNAKDWSRLETLALRQQQMFLRSLSFAMRCPAKSETSETILITGGAGFIGSNLARRLLHDGYRVVVLDNFNNYYDPFLKFESVSNLFEYPEFELLEGDFRDLDLLDRVFSSRSIDKIVHIGARAGVRPSIDDPQLYVSTNVLGTQNLLEMARRYNVKHFLYASSSSVYGGSDRIPFSESQPVDEPISPYAATKKANEVQAACYHRLHGFPVTALRFFTVYGPGGRPDMAIRKFIEKMDRGEPIPLYGDGTFERDYTYIDDIVEGIVAVVRLPVEKRDWCEVINLGESDTTTVREIILLIAKSLDLIQLDADPKVLSPDESKRYIEGLASDGLIERLPEQPGDVPRTFADIAKARELLGYDPQTDIREGIERTVHWHRTRDHSCEQKWGEVLRSYAKFNHRSGLDSLGRPRDPLYTEKDLEQALQLRNRIERLICIDPEHKKMGLWVLAGCHGAIRQIASYLRSGEPQRPWGMTGLMVHRKRLDILKQIHAAAGRSLTPEEQRRILAWANEINHTCGPRETALVVAAAGLGRRIAEHVGGLGQKHRLFLGDEMLLLSLRNALPFTKRIVVVASAENRDDIAETLARSEITEQNGFHVDIVIQENRFGDGDAHLTAAQALSDFEGVILFVFADAPTKSPETIGKMLTIKQALGHLVPLVLPCLVVDEPYAPVVTSNRWPDRGTVLWNWQKADEALFDQAHEARNQPGATNVGLFCAESSVFDYLSRYKHELFEKSDAYRNWQKQSAQSKTVKDGVQGPHNPEFGFADLIKILASSGFYVAAPTLALSTDRLNVNDFETADMVRDLLRRQRPCVRVEIEKDSANRIVTVGFVDMDENGNTVLTQGVPYQRNYTRLSFEDDLSTPEVRETVRKHVVSLVERIETELGLRVIWNGEV